MGDEDSRDFFISYTRADEEAAQWIAWQLESAGHSVIIQAWDFAPGSNFVSEMDAATTRARHVMPILSPAFFASGFTRAEWAQGFAEDPTGSKRRVMPVRIAECKVEGLLGQIVYIDLVGLSPEAAAHKLLANVQPGRAKPSVAPPAPNFGTSSRAQPSATDSRAPDWEPGVAAVPVVWRDDRRRGRGDSGPSMLELQFLPTVATLIPVTTLDRIPQRLAEAGRLGGIFDHGDGVLAENVDGVASAVADDRRSRAVQGLMVTRSAQRGVWVSLPSDMMGSVFDPAEVTPRVAAAISLLFGVDAGPTAERYALTARISPSSMIMLGDARTVGSRTSAQMRTYGPELTLDIEDSVSVQALSVSNEAIAEELVARLAAKLRG